MNQQPLEKLCTACGLTKPLEGFASHKDGKYGRRSQCKICRNAISKRYYQENRTEIRQAAKRQYAEDESFRELNKAASRRWGSQNRERVKANGQRCMAKRQGQTPTLMSAQWVALCERFNYCCGNCGERKPLTIDHVLPQILGGELHIDNVQPLCRECNSSKGGRLVDFRGNLPDVPRT